MEQYSIFCTEEQTKKAFELGAPIKIRPYVTQEKAIDFAYVNAGIVFNCPTAEQMLGWLLEKIDDINVVKEEKGTWLFILYPENTMDYQLKNGFSSRKEATLAAIDAALEYLIRKK